MAKSKFSIKKLNIAGIAIRTAGVGAGSYAAVKVNKIEAVKKLQPWVRGLIKVGVGALVPAFVKVKDPNMQAGIQGACDGFVAIGAIEAASKFDTSLPVISGTGSDVMGAIMFDESYTSPMNGTGDVMGNAGGSTVIRM